MEDDYLPQPVGEVGHQKGKRQQETKRASNKKHFAGW